MPMRHEVRQRDDQPHAPLLHPLAPARQHGWAGPGNRRSTAVERRAAPRQQVGQRQHQPFGAIVQTLPGAADEGRQIGQPALRARQAQPALLRQPVQPADQPCRLVLQIGDQVGARRHREFRRRGRRRRTAIGDEVDQRRVRLVPDRGDQRNPAGGDGAHDDFLVEGHQVFQAAAAARHDQHVGARHRARSKPAIAAAIRSAAPSPCTGTGQSRIVRGKRRAIVVRMSWITAPRSLVTTPITSRQHAAARACGRRRTGPRPRAAGAASRCGPAARRHRRIPSAR